MFEKKLVLGEIVYEVRCTFTSFKEFILPGEGVVQTVEGSILYFSSLLYSRLSSRHGECFTLDRMKDATSAKIMNS